MSNTNFKLNEDYPLKPLRPEVETVHDLSRGLKRHWPCAYDQLGYYRPRRREMPWSVAVAIVVAGALFARVVM